MTPEVNELVMLVANLADVDSTRVVDTSDEIGRALVQQCVDKARAIAVKSGSLPQVDAEKMARADADLFGTGFYRTFPDGVKIHLPANQITILHGDPAAAGDHESKPDRVARIIDVLTTMLQGISDGPDVAVGIAVGAVHIEMLIDAEIEKACAFEATHRHLKRGTTYQLLGPAILQTEVPLSDGAALLAYGDEEGGLWVRPPEEFNDGRFEEIPAK